MSYAATITLTPNVATTTTFRNWAGNVSAQLQLTGMVLAADTGQINFSAVSGPTTALQSMGYEIYRFNDAFQASSPVYFKIEYGSGSVNTNPALWVTVGSGSNGSGTMTGPLTPRQPFNANAAPYGATSGSANAYNSYFSGDTNRVLAMCHFTAGSTTVGLASGMPLGFALERTKDANGNDTGQGVLLVGYGGGFWGQVLWDCKIGMITSFEGGSTGLGMLTPSTGNGHVGSNVAIYPVFHSRGGSFANPGLNVLGYFAGSSSVTQDIANNTTTTISMYGTSHTYMTGGQFCVSCSPRLGGGGLNVGPLFRYE